MSKIICDVCGTSYPDSATQCPICGCVRPGDVNTVADTSTETDSRPNGTYTYVKGGRFSKANVKKRNSGMAVPNAEPIPKAPATEKNNKKSNDRGFIIAVVFLLVAIVAVVIYIALRFFVPTSYQDSGNTTDTTPSTTGQTQDASDTDLGIPCDEVLLSRNDVKFGKLGEAIFMNVTLQPADTTDVVQFFSTDSSVATVNADGRVTAVGPGEAMIIVSCGSAEATCQVVCDFESTTSDTTEATDATEATEATAEQTTTNVDFVLNREDFTLFKKGETWTLYTGDIPVDQITWYSDDETVATIKDGVVTAVGSGYTYVYGEYMGIKQSCKVICSSSVGKAGEGNSPTDTEPTTQGPYKLNTEDRENDVTLRRIGETFILQLLDVNNDVVNVTWTIENSEICSASGNVIEALSEGTTTVSVTYDGKVYSCTVRVVL